MSPFTDDLKPLMFLLLIHQQLKASVQPPPDPFSQQSGCAPQLTLACTTTTPASLESHPHACFNSPFFSPTWHDSQHAQFQSYDNATVSPPPPPLAVMETPSSLPLLSISAPLFTFMLPHCFVRTLQSEATWEAGPCLCMTQKPTRVSLSSALSIALPCTQSTQTHIRHTFCLSFGPFPRHSVAPPPSLQMLMQRLPSYLYTLCCPHWNSPVSP